MKLYTDKAVADWLALTDRRVRQLRDEGVIAERAPGLYEMKTTVTRYVLYLRRGSGKTSLNDERALLTRAKREAADMENGLRRSELHTTEDVEKGVSGVCLNIRSRMLTLPAKLAPKLAELGGDQASIFDELNRAVKEALEEVSDAHAVFARAVREGGAEPEEDET